MPIIVPCPRCSTRLSAPDNAAGKHVLCPKPDCGTLAEVPQFLPAEEVAVVDAALIATKPHRRADDDDDDDDRPKRKARRDEDENDRPINKRKRRRDDDDDDYEFDHPRRRKRKKRGMGAGAITAIVLAAILALGGIGYGVYAVANNKLGMGTASKSPPPAGWRQYTYQKDGFRAYFPSEPAVNSMGGFGGFGKLNIPGAIMPDSFSIYLPSDLTSKLHATAFVIRYTSPLPSNQREHLRNSILKDRNRGPNDANGVRSVRWLGIDADEVISPKNVTRIAFVGNAVYVAEIGTTTGRATAAEESGYFDNFELLK